MSDHLELGIPSGHAADSSFDARALLLRIDQKLDQVPNDERFRALSWLVPRVPSERLLGAEASGDASLWAPPDEAETCALGAAATLVASGADRCQIIEQNARKVWPELDLGGLDSAAPQPRFFGGFAFQPGHAKSSLWRAFGDARFVLPRLSYSRAADAAWLSLLVRGVELWNPDARAELRGLLGRALRALFAANEATFPARVLTRKERSPDEWAELVAAIQREIAAGRAQKIVASRRVSLVLDRPLLPAAVQARLRVDAPESTRFLFRVARSTFLGATPERLFSKRGYELTTEAVAGSLGADEPASAGRLLESEKDGREHQFVVSEITRLLTPLTSELSLGQREIHRLRTVLHLRTPIRARLRQDQHALELVGALHPTPAVGGVPTGAAIDFIAQHEPDERGWYAGPVGWFDRAGDGRFVVALRSGLIEAERAELYAGAGIVRDSNAPSEFAETRWKLAALLGALGVST
jgi:isochorismate synthase